MNPVDYLLVGVLAVLALGTFTLVAGARNAMEGFEDALGFHFGVAPGFTALFPNLTPPLSVFKPAEPPRAATDGLSKGRRKAGSKPPLLPNDLSLDDLRPQRSGKMKRSRKPLENRETLSAQAQLSFPNDESPAI